MNFLKILHGRQSRNAVSNEAVFADHSMDLLLPKLKCHVNDQRMVIACHGSESTVDNHTVAWLVVNSMLLADSIVLRWVQNSSNSYPHYPVPPFVGKFTRLQGQEHVAAIADEDGRVTILDSCQNAVEWRIMSLRAHDNAIFDLCWVENEKRFVTASADQTAILWDVVKQRKISVFVGHSRSIKSVDFKPHDNSVLATGGRDGDIMIWDTRSQKRGSYDQADNLLRNAHCVQLSAANSATSSKKTKIPPALSDGSRGVTTVLFQDENTLISSGAADGLIKVWDLRKNYGVYRNDPIPKYTLQYAGKSLKRNGYSSLLLDSSGTRLFANCTDDVIYQFNCATYEPEPVCVYFGHKNSTFFVKSVLCPREKYILSGSSDNKAYIWRIDKPGLPQYRLGGHGAEVTSVDWCNDPYDHLKLSTCCDDMMFRIWRPMLSELTENESNIFKGSCKKYQLNLDQKFAAQDPKYWMSRIKSFAKYEERRVAAYDSTTIVGQTSSSKASCRKRPIYCSASDLSTPNLPVCNVDQRPMRPKRPKLDAENCMMQTSPLTTSDLESGRKRPVTGKCLFNAATDADPNSQTVPKKRKTNSSSQNSSTSESTSPARSPFKIITGNEHSWAVKVLKDKEKEKEAEEDEKKDFWSPTMNLPNSVTDSKQSIGTYKSELKKRPNDEHWLSKLSNLKLKKKSNDYIKQPEQGRKKMKTSNTTQPILNYFHSIPSSK